MPAENPIGLSSVHARANICEPSHYSKPPDVSKHFDRMNRRNEILDNILTLLMYRDVPIYDKLFTENVRDSTMDSLFELMPQFELEDWMKKSFQQELLHKNYIGVDNNGNLFIKEKGKEFKRKGGYSAIDEKETQENLIREKTIEKFRYDKIAFWFSILAIGISIISLILKK